MGAQEIIEKLKQVEHMDEAYAGHIVGYMRTVDRQVSEIFFPASAKVDSDLLEPYSNEFYELVCRYIFRIAAEVPDNKLNSVIKSKQDIQADLDRWFSAGHKALGTVSAGAWLKTFLPEAFGDPSGMAEELYAILSRPEMIIGLAVMDDKDPRHQMLHLLYALMVNLDPGVCDKLLGSWEKTALGERIPEVRDFRWLDLIKAQMNPGSSLFLDFKSCIQQALRTEELVRTDEGSDVVDISPSGAPIIQSYREDVYQQSIRVYKWMTSISQCGKYLTGKKPDFVERKVKRDAPPPSGCVLASTRLLMADGSYRPITEIEANNRVINADGTDSLCSGEVIRNDHVRILYSINEDEPCMSLEHLVLTASGYKCPDTKTALELNPRLRIARLMVGDVVIKHENGRKVPVRVEKINYKTGNTELCADIHIADGRKSYITEQGYICYANYPEITGGSVLDAVSPLVHDFRKFLEDNEDMLVQSFGRHAYSYISEISAPTDGTVKMNSFQSDYTDIASMERINYRIHSDEPLGFDTMSLIRGYAFFGRTGEPVPLHIEDGAIYWRMGDTSGYARVYHQGFMIKGHLVRDHKQIDFTATTSVFYNMTYKGTWNEGEPQDFGKYEMGYEQKLVNGERQIVPVGTWTMPYEDGSKTVEGIVASTKMLNTPITYYVEKEGLRASVEFPEGIGALQYEMLRCSKCNGADITFQPLFDGIVGKAFRIGEDSDGQTEIGTIEGTLVKEQAEQLREMVSLLGDYQMEGRCCAANVPENERRTLEKAYTTSVEDLIKIPVPDNMADIHSQAFYRMLNMAVYAAYFKEDVTAEVLGISKPTVGDSKTSGDITEEQAKMAEDNAGFLIEQFISSYLSYVYIKKGLSPDCDKELKRMLQPLLDIDQPMRRVKYYMNGHDEKCLGSQKAYSLIMNSVYRSVYRNNVPELDFYYDGDRKDWAKKMYARLTQKETLIGLVNMEAVQPENPQLQHYYTILDILDPTTKIPIIEGDKNENQCVTYATALRKQVMDGILKSLTAKIRLDSKSPAVIRTFEDFIAQYFQRFIKGISDGTFKEWDEKTRDEIRKELEEMAREYGFISVEAMLQGITAVSANIVAEIMAMSSLDLSVRVYQFFKNHPAVSRIMGVAFYGMGIASLLLGFTELDKMSAKEKAEFSAAVVDICMKGISDISVLAALNCFKKGIGDLVGAESSIINGLTRSDFVKVLSRGPKTVKDVLIEIGVTNVEGSTKAGEFWLKMARITTKIAKGIMILTVAVSIGVTGYQIYEDIIHGEDPGILALDFLTILADGIFLATEAISCLAATVCAAVPIIGVVATAVGIVLAFVSIFVKRKPPETPIESLVKNRLKDFVAGIKVPPDWKDPDSDTVEEGWGLPAFS